MFEFFTVQVGYCPHSVQTDYICRYNRFVFFPVFRVLASSFGF